MYQEEVKVKHSVVSVFSEGGKVRMCQHLLLAEKCDEKSFQRHKALKYSNYSVLLLFYCQVNGNNRSRI